MSRRQTEIVPVPEDDQDQDEGMMEIDPFEMVVGSLQTEEGESIADLLKAIAGQLESHNKLMVKLVALATKALTQSTAT